MVYLFQEVLYHDSPPVLIVVESTCKDVFTYEIHDKKSEFLAKEDLHDKEFEGLAENEIFAHVDSHSRYYVSEDGSVTFQDVHDRGNEHEDEHDGESEGEDENDGDSGHEDGHDSDSGHEDDHESDSGHEDEHGSGSGLEDDHDSDDGHEDDHESDSGHEDEHDHDHGHEHGHEEDNRKCDYYITVYPTAQFREIFVTDEPFWYASVTIGVFVLASILFFIFDQFVRRNANKVMTVSVRQNAIVSSLFPKKVQEALMAEAKQNEELERLGKAGIKSFLNTDKESGSVKRESLTSRKPIAGTCHRFRMNLTDESHDQLTFSHASLP